MTKLFGDPQDEPLTVTVEQLLSDSTYATMGPEVLLLIELDEQQVRDIQKLGRAYLVQLLIIRRKKLERAARRQ